ncbi:helix-turn-helix domain-containing protein [Streptomyces sp. H39-S7]|uniref:helix-turn-helix domain-containing protein n=1 Tax=Streptomyces sp. H39-S7 TaxID=3004357 RepID=UPI0022AEB424|nr:helix-turn-helix transcriptional regulator [Streptomyces sp. H39-S7]MCZ4120748.1 helix-turn-helix transcriptional regulator [Streptomyces sp. H39-S7]
MFPLPLRTTITERQRRLGAELRELRERSGLSLAEAGAAVGMGGPHLSHVEAGRTAVATERLVALCRTYGCSNAPYIEALTSMAESKGKGWWSQYRKTASQLMLDLAELEARATGIRTHETLLVPGLLQTESYMRALFRSALPTASSGEIDTLVRFRRARQEILDAESAVTLHAVIHEAALRIAVGGSDVMRGQLTHLIHMSGRPNVTIQVLPFEAGARAWFGNPFLILSAGVCGLETVLVEHPAEPLRLGDDESIARYEAAFAGLSQSALPEVITDAGPDHHEKRDSWGLIQHILYTH